MTLTKRHVRVLVVTCLATQLVTGALWVWSRQGFSRPSTWTYRWWDDLQLLLTWGLGLPILLVVIWWLGHQFDRGRTVSRANRIWDMACMGLALCSLNMVPYMADRFRQDGEFTRAAGLTWTLGMAMTTAAATLGAVLLWFKGTRGFAFLMGAYGLFAGVLFLKFLMVW